MADVGINPGAWTDPRMMLAQQLIQGSADTSPVRSWTQELARALSGPIGAYEATKVRDDRNQALTDIYGGSAAPGGGQGAPAPAAHPDLLSRIGSFFTGNSPSAPAASGSSVPAAPASPPDQTSGAPQVASGAPPTSGAPSPGTQPIQGTSGAPQSPAPQSNGMGILGGGLQQQMYIARRMMQVGRERNQPDLVQQGAGILQNIQQEQAKAQIEAGGKLLEGGKVLNPDGTVTSLGGFNDTLSATEAAKAKGTALGGLDPSVTAGKVLQENTVNTGTMGTAAAKAGMVSGAEAGAKNASELAYAPKITTARDQAAADVALANQPKLEAAKTNAVNQANAGKPLTPEQQNGQEQKLSKDFQDLPIVKEHIAASQGYQNVLAAAKGTDKASDINLIDGLVKMFNPGATVRQSTFENFMEHSQGIPDNIRGLAGSVMNGAHLQPETRAQLVAQATDRMNSSRQIYNQLANFTSQQAASQGLNVKNVVPNFIDPLSAQEELARRRAAAQQQPVIAP